jgi:hypothetical protein
MVHVIRREPVHASDVDTHRFDHARADIVPGQVLAPVRVLRCISHRADESRAMRVFQREHREEVRAVERDMDLAVHHWPSGLDIGDVEQVLVRPAGKADGQRFADA